MKHRLVNTREDYIVHRDDQPGRVEYSRPDEVPPQRILVSLQLLQSANTDLLRVSGNELSLLNDRYRIVGLNEWGDCLDCELVQS